MIFGFDYVRLLSTWKRGPQEKKQVMSMACD